MNHIHTDTTCSSLYNQLDGSTTVQVVVVPAVVETTRLVLYILFGKVDLTLLLPVPELVQKTGQPSKGSAVDMATFGDTSAEPGHQESTDIIELVPKTANLLRQLPEYDQHNLEIG